MRALVTGHRGFVGRHMEKALYDKGYEVFGIDLKDGDDCRNFFKESNTYFDVVVHCAAIVGGRATIEGSPLSVAIDLSIDAELFNWAMRTKPGRVVYYSSSAAYPIRYQTQTNHFSLTEDFIDLEDIQSPDFTYGWAKLTGEYQAQYVRAAGVPVTVLRPFSGYGADQDLDYPWPSFIERAKNLEDPFVIWGDGTQVRDWVHIDDIVGVTMTCIEQGIDGPLNIGTGIPTSFNDFAIMCCEIADYDPEVQYIYDAPKGVSYRVCDPTNMLQIYKPKVHLEDAIYEAIHGKKKEVRMQTATAEEELISETEPEELQAVPEEGSLTLEEPCGAIPFILGVTSNLFCNQPKGHEENGSSHLVELKIYSEPQAHFVIGWTLGSVE